MRFRDSCVSVVRETRHFTFQPDARELPVTLDGAWGSADHRAGFFHREAAEEAKFHDPALARIERGQPRDQEFMISFKVLR